MLPDPYPVNPRSAFRVTLTPPGSKSLTNRALLLAALADGVSTIHRPLFADDTRVMVDALASLGVSITATTPSGGDESAGESRKAAEAGEPWRRLQIEGTGGAFPEGANIQVENAGTAARFLTAACCRAEGEVTIDGSPRMRERPIGELVELLRRIGGRVDYDEREGFLPLRTFPSELRGGAIEIGPTISSQYISALLMIAPLCADGLSIETTGRVTSPTYISMTLGLMKRFDAEFAADPDLARIRIEPGGAGGGGYRAAEYIVEPDASSATYFLAAAALIPGSVGTIEGLGKGSLQGDAEFADILNQMGAGLSFGRDFITVIGPAEALRGVDVDMNSMPDAAMPLAVVAAFARGETIIRGISNLRYKETDRLAALQNELAKLGATVTIDEPGALVIEPAPDARQRQDAVTIETYDDHRMAMAFAVAGAVRPGVHIADPTCVRKTYPAFWVDFGRL